MKRGVAPFLAAGAAAGVLNPRAQLGVLPNGQLCPQPTCTNTLIVAPAVYSEYFPYTAVIDPFRNQVPFTVSNAPTTVILSTQLPQAIVSCGTVTVPVNPTSSTTASTTSSPIASGSGTASVSGSITGVPSVSGSSTASAASSTITTPPTNGLFVGAGLPRGNAIDAADFIVVAFQNLDAPPPAKRQVVKRQVIAGANPIVAVDFATNDADNQFAVDPADCDSGTPLLLSGGMLINGRRAVAKPNLVREAVVGFLVDNMSTPVNATLTLTDGVLNWIAADGVGTADWYSCPDGLWAAFPTLDPARMAQCTRVRVGAIAGAACSSAVLQSRPVNLGFTRPQNLVQPPTSSSSASTTMATVSTSAVSQPTVSTSTVSLSSAAASSASGSSASGSSASGSSASGSSATASSASGSSASASSASASSNSSASRSSTSSMSMSSSGPATTSAPSASSSASSSASASASSSGI